MKQKHMTNFLGKDDVLTLLIHLGYLAYNETTRTVFIPNEEVREEFLRVIRTSGWNEVIRAISHSERLLAETLQQNEQTVAQELDNIHTENTSILSYNDENSLSCVITLAYYSAKKIIYGLENSQQEKDSQTLYFFHEDIQINQLLL